MTQPLNFTPKAIEGLLGHPCPDVPATASGMRYLADKLRVAQVFVLSDSGQLLDRGKPRPEVPGLIFKPPFPVVALEYMANPVDWAEGLYTEAKSSKRIALAWEYEPDLPPYLRPFSPRNLKPGVMVASIVWYDEHQAWFPISAAAHIAYDDVWQERPPATPFQRAMVESGRMAPKLASAPTFPMTMVPLLPEVCLGIARDRGPSGYQDAISADLMDEVNAYCDLCMALACKNVSMKQRPAPKALNKSRIKAGKLPLKEFHVLELAGSLLPSSGGAGDRAGPRSHLRRGHIRRLSADRITWVNQTMVVGGRRGFVDKVYAI